MSASIGKVGLPVLVKRPPVSRKIWGSTLAAKCLTIHVPTLVAENQLTNREYMLDNLVSMASDPSILDSPPWFLKAIEANPIQSFVEVDGAEVNYLAWGPADAPGVVLIHGGAAHANWWSHMAPLLAGPYRVIALDLSGHGDSASRNDYKLDYWCEEVLAVAAEACSVPNPILVGHSMGGFVGIATAALHRDRIGGLIIIDSPVTERDPEVEAAKGKIFGPRRTYPSLDEALARFRTVPEQPYYLPYVFDRVARLSLKAVEGGYSWKYDPNIFVPPRSAPREYLKDVSCRVALLRCELGLVTPDIGEFMYELLGRVAPVLELPFSGHHPMLDQPLVLLTALRALLSDWQHSTKLEMPDSNGPRNEY